VNKHAKSVLPEGAKARQVYLSLRDQISDGRFRDGQTLPGEQKLSEVFGVSRVTVRRALDALAASGLIIRRAGSGTTVSTAGQLDKPVAMNLATLMPQLVEMGQSTTARLLSFSYDAAPDFVASALGLPSDEQVQIATRVRSTNQTPFSHLTTYVPAEIARNYSENDLATTPLFKLLERGGVQIKMLISRFPQPLPVRKLPTLSMSRSALRCLSLRRVVKDVDGNGVEYLAGLYRPDMFRLEMPLTRVGDGTARHWEPAIGKTHEEGA
jgi:GntR family transcriptional regulator